MIAYGTPTLWGLIMGKGVLHLSIDNNVVEMAKLRKRQDSKFSISQLVENFLLDYFGAEMQDLEKE